MYTRVNPSMPCSKGGEQSEVEQSPVYADNGSEL